MKQERPSIAVSTLQVPVLVGISPCVSQLISIELSNQQWQRLMFSSWLLSFHIISALIKERSDLLEKQNNRKHN